MTPRAALSGTTDTMADGLRTWLPSLAAALDEDHAAAQVERLLPRGTAVTGVSVGKAWLRDDGTCTLRYDVRRGPDGGALPGRRVVLCRVHADENAATEYVATRVLPLTARRPWRSKPEGYAWAVVVAGTGIALHPFPLDPELPTLVQAIDPLLLRRLLPDVFPDDGPVEARVVHHPRQGACVLRYGVPDQATATRPGTSRLFGKVYGDASGALVARRLRALGSGEPDAARRAGVRFPVPVTYHRTLRLLLMGELPGSAAVPRLLTRAPTSADGSGDDTATAVADAVHCCGRALAALHRHPGVPAPARGVDREVAELLRELRIVGAVWPGRAERVRRNLPEPPRASGQGRVLCHGDYTHSQVLLSAGVCGLTDLDGLCWADPALDVGRFLASLALLAAKDQPAVTASSMPELTAAFLDGYGSTSTTRGLDVSDPTAGVHFYRRVSLARSALHACRQLKDDRFARALALLESDQGAYG